MKRSSYRTVDPGLRLNPKRRWLWLAVIIIGGLIVFALALTDQAGATTLDGNKGGCGRDNLIAVSCTVTDSGVGFVSGSCEFGYWFSRVSTGRTFPIGRGVTARGCIGMDRELYAPIRISSR